MAAKDDSEERAAEAEAAAMKMPPARGRHPGGPAVTTRAKKSAR